MLSKTKYAQLAAVAALAILFGTNANMTAAQAQGGQPQIEKQQTSPNGGSTTRSGKESRESGSVREGSSTREMRTDRSRENTRTSTRDRNRDNDRSRVTVRDRDRDRDHDRWRHRGRESFGATFVILGPRAVYRSYGSGWCRALHNGRHWAPRIGWHRGRHVGAVRCR